MIGYVHNNIYVSCVSFPCMVSTCGRARPTLRLALIVFKRLHRDIMNDLADLLLEIRLTSCYDHVQTHHYYTRNLTPINYAPHLQ